ncbi:Carboxymuconolactone decarboxylase family protein [Devosia equisanguinis]|uniref:Carboxymuconolactone decarboxylase family protein n=1 Tax=Devosia equisanguinis TaxID=2490941 RepID=A0A3S4EIY6_9HYPH|nr:carboxymuconolactone decarboxylase family protein [Devosia equisanguinis]VDS02892.1 Carboxymuconolactone decarboxylase family protein [Devosia equisanguinis]
MTSYAHLTNALVSVFAFSAMPMLAMADDADATYQNISETYGAVPTFFWQFPREELPNAWEAFSNHQMNPNLALESGMRELIGVAVAAQGSCQSCLYFHTAAALANGASQADILAALRVGEATVRLDAIISKVDVAPEDFRRATDLVLWGDMTTVAVRSPSAEFCGRLLAAVDLAGFCEE